MLAITVPFIEKYACVVAGQIIGLSRHPDYFEYHYRLRDLKKIRIEGLTKFVRVDGQGQVVSILFAEALHASGAKAEQQPADSLTEQEIADVANAILLVNQPEVSTASPKTLEEPSSPAEATDPLPAQSTPNPAAKRSKKKPSSKQSHKPSPPDSGE